MSTARRIGGWIALVALLELLTRAIVYALAPDSAEAMTLARSVGGPRPAVVALVAIGLAAALSTAALCIAARGAYGQWVLHASRQPRPRVPLRRVLNRAVGLTVATWLTFAAVESYIHWRAGLGFHGLSCLWGPVHVNAMPVGAGLAILAAGLLTAAQHLLAWMRRVVATLLLGGPVRRDTPPPDAGARSFPAARAAAVWATALPRPPPLVVQ